MLLESPVFRYDSSNNEDCAMSQLKFGWHHGRIKAFVPIVGMGAFCFFEFLYFLMCDVVFIKEVEDDD